MVSEIKDIKTIVVNNEKESLILETTLIKKHKPKYNILMKDDKNHLYIKITDEEIPKVIKTRIKTNSWTYFWPYISSNYVSNILKITKKIFWHRSCNIKFENSTIKSTHWTKIPCIDYYTKRCAWPCLLWEKEISEYKKSIENIKNFINWDFKNVISGLQEKMLKKASELKFEEAGKIKQDIESIKSLEEIQIVREAVKWDYEVINYLEKYDKLFIWLVSIRDGKINDLKNYEIQTHLDENIEEILIEFIEREIVAKSTISEQKWQTILLPIEIWNSGWQLYKFEIPKSWPKHDLLKFVYKNLYEYAYKKHIDSLSTKWFTKQTMKNLLSMLWYKEINKDLAFECNDISHLSWSHTVASRSIIENWKPNKNKYRKFNIKTLPDLKIDDFASMREIMTRRLKELIEKWNLPDLIIIDGWVGQLNAVLEVVENEKLINSLQLVSIAKKEEELFLPWVKEPIILDKDSQELRLVQKIRDEAHRFAITFNKEKRLKSEKKNLLESIPWIWPKTRIKLIKTYWNIDNLKWVTIDELQKILSKNQIEALENHGII